MILTNGAGLHSVSIPEHVLGLMLMLARNLHESARLQARASWERFPVIAFGGGIRELDGSNLAILGAGAIGASLARLGRALGHERARAAAATRPSGRGRRGGGRSGGQARAARLGGLRRARDAAHPRDREPVDRAALRAMKSSAYLINIARGECIEDEALLDALRAGAIAGAGLDTFREEPLPATSPYWALPNVIVTPHISGYTPRYFERTLELFRDNLRRFVAGERLRNVVNKRLGYVDE